MEGATRSNAGTDVPPVKPTQFIHLEKRDPVIYIVGVYGIENTKIVTFSDAYVFQCVCRLRKCVTHAIDRDF